MKKLKIDLYNFNFYVTPYAGEAKDKSWKLTGVDLDSQAFENCNGMVVFGKDTCLVWMPTGATVSTLAHEALHVASYIMRVRGFYHDLDNQEPMAYLVGHITGLIDKARKSQ